jgi:DNA repair ATPase RecN
MNGGRLQVDDAALREGARQVEQLAQAVDDLMASDGLGTKLLMAESTLNGAASQAPLAAVTDAITALHADLTTALLGLSEGLEAAAERYTHVDTTLAEIGQLLRHRDQRTTAIYAKVDRAALDRLARPWPGAAS